MKATYNSRAPWVAAGLTCILAFAILAPQVEKRMRGAPPTEVQAQETPMPAAYVGERPPHELDSKEARCIASYARFRALRPGMKWGKVYETMGCEGETTSGSYQWRSLSYRSLGGQRASLVHDHHPQGSYDPEHQPVGAEMSAVALNRLGGQVRAQAMKVASAEVLARALFDGKREHKVADWVVVTPDFGQMTSHEQTILKGLFLKAEVKPA